MNEKILFIGGPKDGRRERIPQQVFGHQIQIASFARRDYPTPNDYDMSIGVQTHTFTIKEIVLQNGNRVKIAVHSSVKDPMEQLVRGYRYHRNPRRKYR